MPLPKSVQRDLERAEAIQQSLSQPPVAQPLAPLLEPPLVEAPLVAIAAPVVAAVPTPPAEDKAAYWENRAKSVMGMMQTEIPALRNTIKSMETEIQTLKSHKPPQETPKPTVDPKDVEAFGAEMIEMVQRYAERTFASIAAQVDEKLNAMESRMASLEQGVSAVSTSTAVTQESQFFAALDRLVPQWETVNTDPRWLSWLAEVDPIYGQSRQTALDYARTNFDAQRTANIFNSFIASITPPSLASLVAPTTTAAPAPTMTPGPQRRIYTQREYQVFYNDLAKGRYRGREAEAHAIEAELNLAQSENRIR